MSDRIISILHNNSSMADNVKKMIEVLLSNSCAKQVYVFTEKPDPSFNIANGMQICTNINWPGSCKSDTQIRNWINQFFKTNNFSGKLHVLEDNTDLLKIPTDFICDIEHTMDVLDYHVWFSTVCDNCNYLYAKYNPRLAVVMDKVEYFPLGLGNKLLFTSHSNTQWIVYDFAKVPDDLLKFDEDFTIAMYYIIEYLARRRNTKAKNSVYFMNQYLTVESELGTFKALPVAKPLITEEQMKKEDELFKQKTINYAADNNIDAVLESIYATLNCKVAKL